MTGRPVPRDRGRRGRPLPDPLRRDVRLLTTLLGDAIRRTGGAELFGRAEALRRASIALHESPTDARLRAVERLVAELDPGQMAAVARRVRGVLPARERRRGSSTGA